MARWFTRRRGGVDELDVEGPDSEDRELDQPDLEGGDESQSDEPDLEGDRLDLEGDRLDLEGEHPDLDGDEPDVEGDEPDLEPDEPELEEEPGTEDDLAVPPVRTRRRSSGRRRRARRAQRRRRRLRIAGMVLVLVAVAVVGMWSASLLPFGQPDAPADPDDAAAGGEDGQLAVVFATLDEQDPTRGADLVFVLAPDAPDGATLLFLPVDAVADIPGFGLDRIGRAYAFGGGPLLDATVDNLLGVDFDGVVEVSAQGWASLFGRLGGLTVDVPERLVRRTDDGAGEVRFEAGRQTLDGPRLAELLTFQAGDESGLVRLGHARLVLESLFDTLAAEPGGLDELFSDGAPMLDTSLADEDVRAVLATAAAARADEDLAILTLPVSPIGSGEEGALRVDTERAQTLVLDRFAGSVPEQANTGGRRLQILNGNGQPGIGQEVAQRLIPAGFRVVLTDNADHFGHEETLILVYDDDPAQLALARDVQRLLGVGRVELSRTPQSVVDVTIVVGRDFLGQVPPTP